MKGIYDSTGIDADAFAQLFGIPADAIPSVHIVQNEPEVIEGEYTVGNVVLPPYSETLPEAKR